MNRRSRLSPIARRTALRVLLVAGAVMLPALAWWSGLLNDLRDPGWLAAGGWKSCVFYVAAFIVLGGVGVPPALLIVPLSLVWPVAVAIPMALVGGLGSATVGFLLSRHVARDFLADRVPEKVRIYEDRLESHGLSTVIVLRLLFFLFPPVNWLLGISRISLPVYLLGTLIGALPATLAFTLTGRGLVGLVTGLPAWGMLLVALGAVAGLILWWRFVMAPLHRRMTRSRADARRPGDGQ